MRKSKHLLMGAVIGVALSVVGGAAWAAIPGANGTITACHTRLTFRVIDADAGARCSGAEQRLAWNQSGPTGPTGPVGPAGPAGQTSVIAGRFGAHWPIVNGTTEVLQGLQLPNTPGTYLIQATARVHTDFMTVKAYLFCDLYAGIHQLDSVIFDFNPDEAYGNESAQLTGWLDASGLEVVELRCHSSYDDSNGLGSNIGIDSGGAVIATRVDSLTEAP